MPAHSNRRRQLMLVAGAAGALALLTFVRLGLTRVTDRKASGELAVALYGAYCMPQPAAAIIADDMRVDCRYEVDVPATTPDDPVLPDNAVHQIHQNDSVEFDVRSPRDGALAVHGLSSLTLIVSGTSRRVRFKAIYSGRFPLHFHGPDGAHFEIAVLEILPTHGEA